MKSPNEHGTPRARGRDTRLRTGLLVCIGILYCLSVPWYRSDSQELSLFLGLPDWVAVAVICYGLVAVLNSLAWMQTPIDDDAPLPPVLLPRGSEKNESAVPTDPSETSA
ncbi:MAG TPA: hypothetical protein EYQ54_13765 [Myxococcales bacterium]|nr:hypothetical protein [Myxococcales bacterium]HIL00599.1 hypothetical protein [Myxococcales bacterium]